MNKEELQKEVDRLAPWHYCHQFPFGIVTGTSKPDGLPEKMDWFFKHNTFDRPVYPRVLDLGANSGIIGMWFVDNKDSIVDAVERGPKYYPQLELALNVKHYTEKINPIFKDICEMDFGESQYDLVLFLGTMHHLAEDCRLEVLKKSHSALYPGGQIVVQTKTELPVAKMLESVGFLFVEYIGEMEGYHRAAWKAQKDAMKI